MKTTNAITQLLLGVFLVVVFAGCHDATHVGMTDPTSSSSDTRLQSLSKSMTISAFISAKDGGSIVFNYKFKGVNIAGSLYFPPGSVSQDLTASLAMDNQTIKELNLSFSPSAVFLQPALLNLNASGLDLSWIPPSAKIGLYYYNPDTDLYEQMVVQYVGVNQSQGTLTCKNGQIPHFSRYAFAR